MDKIIFFLAFLLLVGAHPCFFLVGQVDTTAGLKYIENYSPHKDSGSQPQNWAVLQDTRGIIYLANQGGVLEFDGVSWRLIDVPHHSVRSLAMDALGTLYTGGVNEIGFLAPDANGSSRYVSLTHYLTGDKKNFSTVWYTLSNPEGIYFMTSKFLFRWDPGSKHMETWGSFSSFRTAFICNGILFIQQTNAGLMQMKKDTLQPAPGGEGLAGANVEMLVPYDTRTLLIGTRKNGFYLYDGMTCKPFPTGADDYLEKTTLYHGIRLSAVPGEFAAATLRGGLVIFDSQGRLKQIFDKASGLQDDSVMYVFEEPGGNLWLALSKGISRLEYASPVSVYDDRTGLTGIVLAVSATGSAGREIVYAGTTLGLFNLAPSHKFRPVPGIPVACWSLLSYSGGLLAAANDGVYRVETGDNTGNAGHKPAHKIIDFPSYVLYRSPSDPNRTWVGTANGLVSLYLPPPDQNPEGQWHRETEFKNITEPIKTIVEDKKGNLWLGTRNRGIIKVAIPTLQVTRDMITHYDASHGLPTGGVNVFTAAGHVIFATEKGLYRYDETGNRFFPDTTLGKTYAAEGRQVFRIAEDQNRDIWFHSRSRNYRAILKPGGVYDVDTQPFPGIPPAQVNAIYPGPGGNAVWFAGVDGLVRFDTTVKKKYATGFSTCIRKVIINGKRLLFGGYPGLAPAAPVLEYRDRNPRFDFAAPFFEGKSETLYQCVLEGYDNDWTAWNKESQKEYTNLEPGQYTFRVRAKNVHGTIGSDDFFRFKVLPPWYRTWWAFLVYAVTALLIMYLVVKWRSWKLVQEKQKLEQIIKKRTEKINDQKQQLLEQAKKLKEMDKVKSRFFANISHEFRTPLTLIMGPLEQILPACREEKQKKQLKMMLRNSRRLLALINQLLELSKFDSGTMKLQAARREIVPFLKGIFHSFDSLAMQKEVELIFQTEAEDITLYYDPGKLEEVISNLVSNAIKFTPSGGVITLAVKVIKAPPDPGAAGEQDILEVSVSDTGPGIPREELAHIFDRFYQAERTYEYHRQGTGIGLAIAREIVELHHGTITAYSPVSEGTGARLVIQLPMGDAHLKPGEMVESYPVPKTPGGPTPGEIEEDEEEEIEPVEKEEETRLEPAVLEKDIILVVEDSADVREYIRGALEPHYSVKEAKDGIEGLRLAKKIIPDLIICDIMMPGPDGYEVCRGLKTDISTSHIPVILLTAKAGEECIVAGLETGADDYITKPFSTKILCTRIKNLIDLRRHLRETFKREMTLKPAKIKVSPIDEEFLKDLYRMLEKNMSDQEFNVEELSRKLYMNRVTLYRKINALTGDNPTEFIRSYRLKRGAEMLETTSKTVLEVAFEVGFSSSSYFIKCFKEKFHRLPTQYQRAEKMKEERDS